MKKNDELIDAVQTVADGVIDSNGAIRDELREIRSALVGIANTLDRLIIAQIAEGDAYRERLHQEAQDRIDHRNYIDERS